MKKNLRALAIGCIAMVSVAACKKSESSTSSSTYTMTATRDGSSVTISGDTKVYAVVSGPVLQVIGANISGSDTTGFVFMITNYTGVGSYSLDGSNGVGEYVSKSGSSSTVVVSTSGTLNVTSNTSPQLKGTFNFSGMNISTSATSSVTNGSFTAKMQ